MKHALLALVVVLLPSLASAQIGTNLLACWALGEASGSRADSKGSNTLTDNNTVTSNTGKVGTAAEFVTANSEYLSAASNSDLQTGDVDFTFQAWVYLADTSGSYIILSKDDDDPANSRDYTLDFSSGSGKVRFYINGGGGGLLVETTASISATTWYHVIAGHDAANNQIFISVNNETRVTATTSGTAPHASSAEFRIGARVFVGSEGYMNGRVDEVALWESVVNTTDASTLYNSGNGQSCASIVGGGGPPAGSLQLLGVGK